MGARRRQLVVPAVGVRSASRSVAGPVVGDAGASVRSATVPTLAEERRLWKDGHRWVAGLDEVGRGAWAGPISVGVALVRPGSRKSSVPKWLRDSKMLAEDRRESIFDEVAGWTAGWAVGHASAAECDLWGMTAAQRLAAQRAVAGLAEAPEAALIDGPFDFLSTRLAPGPGGAQGTLDLAGVEDGGDRVVPPVPWPDVRLPGRVVTIVGADARCAAVAAASVLAKVVRDRMMREEAEHFPAYHFERNKGYPSPLHQTALRGYGLSAIHRRSWAFVEDLPWRRPRVPSSAALARARAEAATRTRAVARARSRAARVASADGVSDAGPNGLGDRLGDGKSLAQPVDSAR